MFYRAGLLAGVGCLAVAMGAGEAHAQAPTDVGDVVVTARRVPEKLRDVPIAGTVIDAEVLAQRPVLQDVGAILNDTPSSRYNDLGNTALSEATLRVSGTARGTNADTGIGLYANGVYIQGGIQFGRNFVSPIDLFDLGRAEVLRGTLGGLYGRNAVGGSVNLFHAEPKLASYEGSLNIAYGVDTEGKNLKFVQNLGISEHLALRVGLNLIDQDEGFAYNPTLDRHYDEQHGWAGRIQLRYNKGPLDVVLVEQAQNVKLPFGGIRLTIAPTAAQNTFPRGYTQEQYSYPNNTPRTLRQRLEQQQLNINYDFDFATLTSTSSYRFRKTDYLVDADFLSPEELVRIRSAGNPAANTNPYLYQEAQDKTFIYYQDVRLASNDLGPLNWLVGVELVRNIGQFRQFDENAASATTSTPSLTRQKLVYDSQAYYVALRYDLSDEFQVSTDLRYTNDEKRFTIVTVQGAPHVSANTPPTPLTTITTPFTLRRFSDENVSYNLTGNYKFAARMMAYAKVGTAYRAGGFNSAIDPPNVTPPKRVPATFDSETSTTFEVGFKGNLVPAVYTTIAAYRTNTDNAIVRDTNGCGANVAACPQTSQSRVFATNSGDAKATGLEIENNYRFEFMGGNGSLGVNGSTQTGKIQSGNFAGARLPQTPKWTASATLSYQRPIIDEIRAFGVVKYRGQWGGVQDLSTGSAIPLVDFQVLDVRGGVRTDSYELAVYATNVTNTQYQLLEAANNERVAPPRLWGVELRYKW